MKTIEVELDNELERFVAAKAKQLNRSHEWIILRCVEATLMPKPLAQARAVFRSMTGGAHA